MAEIREWAKTFKQPLLTYWICSKFEGKDELNEERNGKKNGKELSRISRDKEYNIWKKISTG